MQKKILFTLFVLFAQTVLLAACSPKPEVIQNGIEISQTRLVLPPASENGIDLAAAGAAYMLIKNTARTPDRLVAVSADFGEASLHETIIKGDVMSMDAIAGIDFPAGALMDLKPASYHIMIMNPSQNLKSGDTVQLMLDFEQAGHVSVPLKVTRP
jgi:copper(I)-binding protein